MRALAVLLISSLFSATTFAAGIDLLSNKDAVGGLKQALTQGASAAVGKLGVSNGFLNNPKVKIPLPDSLQQVEGVLRSFGMSRQADELIETMNHAAEAAVPEAKALLISAVKKMSIEDAKGILTGGNDAATQYFRKNTSGPLAQKFLPIVKKATAKVGLAGKYNELAGKASRFGLVDEKDANLENYVTQKALDGLYLMMAEEERAIRQDPVGQGSKLLQKVFGALR